MSAFTKPVHDKAHKDPQMDDYESLLLPEALLVVRGSWVGSAQFSSWM